ncbi:MAG: hypothetical protein QOE35_3609 [Actinomycetota bacterium]|jgi:hypothetical protein
MIALVGGCQRQPTSASILDGRARVPDAEGVVTAVTLRSVTLDGGRSYDVSRQLESFSVYNGAPTALLAKRGQYVQVGVRAGKVVWIQSFGTPVGDPPAVVFTGELLSRIGSRLRFSGGATLRLADGVQPPPVGDLECVIAPRRHAVVGYSVLSGAASGA